MAKKRKQDNNAGGESVKNDGRIKIAASTVVLFIICAALAFASVAIVAKSLGEEKMMEGIKGRNILGVTGTVGRTTDKTEYGDYSDISALLSRLRSTHTEWTNIDKNSGETGFSCIATEDTGRRMVYNLDPENVCGRGFKMRDFNYIWVDSVNPGFYCLINIPGETVDLSGYYILVHDDTGNLASRLIINCYEAKVVKLKDTIVTGTLLAPDANIEYSGTIVYGGVYAKASTGARSYFKQIPFGGYEEILKESEKVSFVNTTMRTVTLAWLKNNIPEEYKNYPDDYVLLASDLARITDLNLDGKIIADMYGDLDHLVNLESLSVKQTKLKKLDVSMLPNLKTLDIRNTDISDLSLPVSGSVKTLLADNTKLSMLETSKLSNVVTLSAKGVKFLMQPDYRSMRMLETLNVSDTNLSAGALDGILTLKTIKKIEAAGNKAITSVDLTALPLLEYANFSECSLSSVNVAGCGFLKEINISYNSFANVDLSGAPALTKVEAYGSYGTVTVSSSAVSVSKLPDTKIVYKN